MFHFIERIVITMADKKVNRKRDKVVAIRMNKSEYETLLDKVNSSGLTQQSFIINSIKGATISSSDELEVLKDISKSFSDLVRQLRGLSTNVNQMAHIANGQGYLPTITELDNTAKMINLYREESEDLWQSIRSSINQQNHMGQ